MPDILYIEDSRAFQRLMTKYLPEHYALKIVDNLDSGWEEAQTGRYQLIITDFMFPKGDAFELIFKVRQVQPPLQLPILVLTSVADRFLISKFFSAGVNATINKPPNVPQLREMVAGMLQQPWVEKPDFICDDAHLLTWAAASQYFVYCPNLHLLTEGPCLHAAMEAMQAQIEKFRENGARIPPISNPKQTVYFAPVESGILAVDSGHLDAPGSKGL